MKLRWLGIGFILCCAAALALGLLWSNESVEERALDDARALWNDSALVDFDYVYRNGPLDGSAPKHVEVRNGTIVRAETGELPEAGFTGEKTVEHVFERAESLLKNGRHRIEISYNQHYGYPERVAYETVEEVRDGGGAYEIWALRPASDYPETCSANGRSTSPSATSGLSPAAQATRAALVAAASSCDFTMLAALTNQALWSHDPDTFGSELSDLWTPETEGQPVLLDMVVALEGDPRFLDDETAVWSDEASGAEISIEASGRWAAFVLPELG